MKKFICVLLCFFIAVPWMSSAAFADDSTNGTVYITISNESELRSFANSCRLDTWSENVVATLTSDIYLSGDFTPAPVFSGTFDGQKHTIYNLSVDGKYSRAGLFGLLSESAQVKNLNVSGSVAPHGEVVAAGGIAGENKGYIESCVFLGEVSSDSVSGGIAGINSGVINGCANFAEVDVSINKIPKTSLKSIKNSGVKGIIELVTSGSMDSSSDRSGGIAGENTGSILSCKNDGPVGSTKKAHNVGGIAGVNSGTILLCSNYASIQGYSNVGGIVGQTYPYFKASYSDDILSGAVTELYNVTDIIDAFTIDIDTVSGNFSSSISDILTAVGDASTQAGYITVEASSFVNGKISEVNQIVSLANETLTGLEDLSSGIDEMGNEFIEAIQSFTTGIKYVRSAIQGGSKEDIIQAISYVLASAASLEAAMEDVNQMTTDLHTLMENLDDTQFPDFDSIPQSLTNSITGLTYSIKKITASVDSLNKDMNSAVNALTGTVRNITSEVKTLTDSIYSIVYSVSDLSLSTFINDISGDSFVNSQNYHGIVQSCINTGSVEGVGNVGGIAGSMSITTSINADNSESESGIAFKTLEYRSIVATSKNYGDVAASGKNSGGIVGNEAVGAVTECENYGYVLSDSTNVGGIAGSAHGLIRSCFVRSTLQGKSYTGGIVGIGSSKTAIIDESSLINNFAEVEIYGCDQHNGGIAGSDTGYFLYNYFVSDTLNGFEGYSAEVEAAPITRSSLLGVQNCPEEFSWSDSQLRAVQTCTLSGTHSGSLTLLQLILAILLILLTIALIVFIIFKFRKCWVKANSEIETSEDSSSEIDEALTVLNNISLEADDCKVVSVPEEIVESVENQTMVVEECKSKNSSSDNDSKKTSSATPSWKDAPVRKVSWKDCNDTEQKPDSGTPKWKYK